MQTPTTKRGGTAGPIFAIVVIGLMVYLTFAALQGEHGLFRLFQIEAQESRLRTELSSLQDERAAMQNKASRLTASRLDLDLLDEQARRVLGLGRSEEIIVR